VLRPQRVPVANAISAAAAVATTAGFLFLAVAAIESVSANHEAVDGLHAAAQVCTAIVSGLSTTSTVRTVVRTLLMVIDKLVAFRKRRLASPGGAEQAAAREGTWWGLFFDIIDALQGDFAERATTKETHDRLHAIPNVGPTAPDILVEAPASKVLPKIDEMIDDALAEADAEAANASDDDDGAAVDAMVAGVLHMARDVHENSYSGSGAVNLFAARRDAVPLAIGLAGFAQSQSVSSSCISSPAVAAEFHGVDISTSGALISSASEWGFPSMPPGTPSIRVVIAAALRPDDEDAADKSSRRDRNMGDNNQYVLRAAVAPTAADHASVDVSRVSAAGVSDDAAAKTTSSSSSVSISQETPTCAASRPSASDSVMPSGAAHRRPDFFAPALAAQGRPSSPQTGSVAAMPLKAVHVDTADPVAINAPMVAYTGSFQRAPLDAARLPPRLPAMTSRPGAATTTMVPSPVAATLHGGCSALTESEPRQCGAPTAMAPPPMVVLTDSDNEATNERDGGGGGELDSVLEELSSDDASNATAATVAATTVTIDEKVDTAANTVEPGTSGVMIPSRLPLLETESDPVLLVLSQSEKEML
jgi:hypothetical protein